MKLHKGGIEIRYVIFFLLFNEYHDNTYLYNIIMWYQEVGVDKLTVCHKQLSRKEYLWKKIKKLYQYSKGKAVPTEVNVKTQILRILDRGKFPYNVNRSKA